MNPRKFLVLTLIVILPFSTLNLGCGAINKLMGKDKQQAQQSGKKEKQEKIGVVLTSDKDLAPLKKGLMDAAKKEDVKLVFLEAKDGKKGFEQKGKDIKALIVQGGSKAGSSDSGEDIVKAAEEKKVPIIAIDHVQGAKVEGMVVPDYFKVGEIQADFVKNKLKQGNVVLLQSPGPAGEEVTAGNKTSLAQSGLKIIQTFVSPTEKSSPVSAFDDFLKANPDKVQAVIATDSDLAAEAIETLKKKDLNKKVLVVGAGTDKEAIGKIMEGDLSADVDKSPYLQGLYAYKLAAQVSKKQAADADRTVVTESGETPAKLVPVQLVQQENAAKFQRIYSQPVAEEEAKEDKGGSDSQKGQEQGSEQKSQSDKPKSGDQQGQKEKTGLTAKGVSQVRERIRTETTRELLDKDGKVMGTEKEVKEEVRTLPATLMDAKDQAKEQQAQGKKQDQKEGDKQQGDQKQGDQQDQKQE